MKINFKLKPHLGQIIGGLIAIVLAFFLIRVALWEKDYYSSMEGSTRAVAITNVDDEDAQIADETEVTEEVRKVYTVPATHPRYLSIEKLGIVNARVLNLGLTSKGAFATPTSIYDVGWYNASALPGSGGTILLDGHNGGPTKAGVFKHLDSLKKGDIITIETGNGYIYKYEVEENLRLLLADATNYMPTAMTSPIKGRESVTIITCSGTWDRAAKTYDSRQFVRAVRI